MAQRRVQLSSQPRSWTRHPITASPVVIYADETGWREDGANGYVCRLSAPPPSATSCGGVGAKRWWTKRWAMLGLRSIGQRFRAPPSHHYDGPKQRCWSPSCCGTILFDHDANNCVDPKDARTGPILISGSPGQLYVAAKACNSCTSRWAKACCPDCCPWDAEAAEAHLRQPFRCLTAVGGAFGKAADSAHRVPDLGSKRLFVFVIRTGRRQADN